MKNLIVGIFAIAALVFASFAGTAKATDCHRGSRFLVQSFQEVVPPSYFSPHAAFFSNNRIATLDAYGNVVFRTAFNPTIQFRSFVAPAYAYNLPIANQRIFVDNGFRNKTVVLNTGHRNIGASAVVLNQGHRNLGAQAFAFNNKHGNIGAQAVALGGGGGFRSRAVSNDNRAVASSGGLFGFGFIGPNAQRAVVNN